MTNGPVTIFRRGEWWFVGCEKDWMACQSSGSVDDLFSRVVPFPEAGPNCMHSEVLLTAFAKDVLLRERATLRILKGGVAMDDEIRSILQRTPQWKRGVVFRLDPKDGNGSPSDPR